MNKKAWIVTLVFVILFVALGVYFKSIYIERKNDAIKVEALTGKEFKDGNYSAGNCRVVAVNKAYELKDVYIVFFRTNGGSDHVITIDENNTVYDLSDSAIEYQQKTKTNLNNIKYKEYKKYVASVIYKVHLVNRKIVNEFKTTNLKHRYKVNEYRDYVVKMFALKTNMVKENR